MERLTRGAFGLLMLVFLLGFLALTSLLAGCVSQNTGSSIAVGDITSLPEIQDAADSISVKILLMMTGAKVWTAKDSLVTVSYANAYTNTYCGIIERKGKQDLTVRVEPLETAPTAETAATVNP